MERHAESDSVLAILVNAANHYTETVETGIDLTLTLPGLVVSGSLISAWQWFREVATIRGEDELPEGGPSYLREFSDGLKQDAVDYQEAFEKPMRDWDRQHKRASEEDPTYIHMKDARVWTGPDGIPHSGVHWRGRLAAVVGWSYGTLVAERAQA